MNKLKELLNGLLIKLKLKQPKKYNITEIEQEFDVGKSVVTFLMNDGSSSSITLEGTVENQKYKDEDNFYPRYSEALARNFIVEMNCYREETLINISPTKMNQHFVRRSDIRRLTVVHSSHIVKVKKQVKTEVK